MSWGDLAAAGTDADLVARVVALHTDAAGRDHLRAATQDGGLFTAARLADAALPDPTRDQRAGAAAAAATWAALGVRVMLRGDPAWPARLDRLASPPLLLGVRGRLPDAARPAVALVGARRATPYGTGVAAWLADAAAGAGAVVVSGGARGIDAAAHDAAADRGTVVVLGCGHDVAYPRPHARPGGLFDRILAGGGAIIAELLPGTPPRPHHVRARNRIVAGLADVVVVVEGSDRSGSLVTASEAADAGVDVLAVPGDVRAPGSAAPHRLLREGAGPCTAPTDLLAALSGAAIGADAGIGGGKDGPDRPHVAATCLPPEVHRVLAASWPRPLSRQQVADRSGVPLGRVLAALTRARVDGVVAEGPAGVRLSRSPDGG